MSNENQKRDIDINRGNYNEFIQGDYIQGNKINQIQTNNLPQPKTGFPQNIPSSNTNKFIGRERELEILHQQLQEEDIAYVEGMGGIGKTELAIQYCLKSLNLSKKLNNKKTSPLKSLSLKLNWIISKIFKQKSYSYPGGICWLNTREQNIDSQIIEFAQSALRLKIPEDQKTIKQKAKWCWKNWSKEKTLIIFDDVKNYSDIKPYLSPKPTQFKILITTRLNIKISNPLDLKVLSEKEALDLLKELINSKKVQQESEKAKEICQRLGYLPLAIQLVGKYIKKNRISIDEEIQRLESKGLTHPSINVPENDPTWNSNINRGVAAAFELSWNELSTNAQELGCLLSLFALTPIPWQLVKDTTEEKDKEKLENTRTELENYHLLQNEESNYQLHQLIQEFFQAKQKNLTNADQQKSQICTAIVKIAQEIPEATTLSDISYFTPFIPHLTKAINFYQEWISDQDLIWPFVGISRFYEGQGAYNQALPWREKCLSISKKRLGEEHPHVADSLNNLAGIYSEQGRYSEAEPLCIQALEMRKKVLEEEHLDIAQSLNNLAAIYWNQGRYKETEPLLIQALEMRKKLLGEEHIDIAESLNNLAVVYDDQGRYLEAEDLHLQALEMRKKLLGEEHIDIAESLNNLAALYHSQGKYKKAETLYIQALKIRKKLLGESHPQIALSLYWLAFIYDKQGKKLEAKSLYEQALKIYKKTLGETHPDTINCQEYYKRLIKSQN